MNQIRYRKLIFLNTLTRILHFCSHQQHQPGASFILGGHHQQQQQQQQHSNYHNYRQPNQARPGQFPNNNNFNKIKKVDPSNMSSYETNPVGALQVMVLNVLSLLAYSPCMA